MPTDRTDDPTKTVKIAGPLGDLTTALRELHAQAWRPTTREIAAATEGTVAHETVAAMLRHGHMPRWSKLAIVVAVLAGRTRPPLDRDVTIRRFEALWLRADGQTDMADCLDHAAATGSVIEAYLARRRTDQDADPEFIGQMSTALARVLYAAGAGHDADMEVRLLSERLASAAYEVVHGLAHPLAPLLDAIDAGRQPSSFPLRSIRDWIPGVRAAGR